MQNSRTPSCRRFKVKICRITASLPASKWQDHNKLLMAAWQTSLLVIHLNQMAKKPAVCSSGSTFSNGVTGADTSAIHSTKGLREKQKNKPAAHDFVRPNQLKCREELWASQVACLDGIQLLNPPVPNSTFASYKAVCPTVPARRILRCCATK